MRGPATTIIRSAGTFALASGYAAMTRRRRCTTDARAADGDDAHLLVGLVAELGAEGLAVAEGGRVEPGDVAGEVEVLGGPVADERQVGAEGVGHDVAGVSDVDRPVAQARVPGDVLDHLRVVVSGEEGLAVAAVVHRQPPDEVGEPAVRGPLLLRVLVQVVVELPGLVADPQVVLIRRTPGPGTP